MIEWAKKIRAALRALFTSRLAMHLEWELLQTRKDFESRLADKERQMGRLLDDNLTLRCDNERMKLVLMPLSSAGGAAYAEMLNPRKRNVISMTEPPISSWEQMKRDHIRREDEAARAAEKENASGLQK